MENIEAMLCAYIEGDLDEAGRAQIEKHLAENPQHRKLIQDLISMREMVRTLPRVKAPADVGESLQLQTERAILLDDSPAARSTQGGGTRWSQLLAIAAIFLLCASLCLVLYRALGPTLKSPVYTENTAANSAVKADREGGNAPMIEMDKATPMAQVTPNALTPAGAAGSVDFSASVPAQPPMLRQKLVQFGSNTRSVVDVDTVRRRLADSGYGINAAAGSNAAPPVLMVVNSSNPSAANSQVTQFLNNNSGISWRKVPADQGGMQQVGQQQKLVGGSGGFGGGGGGPGGGGGVALQRAAEEQNVSDDLKSGKNAGQNVLAKDETDSGLGAPAATQPSSDLYVAKGLTPQQAAVLQQSLSTQNGAEVILQSGAVLATTQPSSVLSPAGNSLAYQQTALSDLATRPSDNLTANPQIAAATTAPSNLASAAALPANGSRLDALRAVGQAQNNQSLAFQNVDAVIIVQPASALASPATQPALEVPALSGEPGTTQPSPTTQP